MTKTECEHFRTLHLKLLELNFLDCSWAKFCAWPKKYTWYGRMPSWPELREANLNGKQMPDMAKF